ncbi:MAG: hypothetical protein NTV34_16035, partial [Proteobacteria bacterium]|nr:hypothetical protein [Pseudomonadota bacterium]
QTGSQSQMQGWAAVMVERDSGLARVSEADVNGNLKFGNASLEAAYTIVLLSPDYLTQSVLSFSSDKAKTVRQFFQPTKKTLPRLVQKGASITFQSLDGISVLEDYAADTDSDGMPDGIAGFGFVSRDLDDFLGLVPADKDLDGIDKSVDIDIDGDGVVNSFDNDDDGDGVHDVLDSDGNGDNVADSLQQASDQHFAAGLAYIAVQSITTSTTKSLKFVAKVRDGVAVKSVKIRGAATFMKDATMTTSDGTVSPWDSSLADDGKNDDASEKDLLYVRSVNLAAGVAQRTNQAVFFQLLIGEGADQFTVEYPYIFSNLTAAVPTTGYVADSRTVTLVGDPFGEKVQDFLWSVSVKNSSGIKVFESNLVAGVTRTSVVPSNVLVAGQTYTYRVTAQLLDKVPGYPAMIVYSDETTINP